MRMKFRFILAVVLLIVLGSATLTAEVRFNHDIPQLAFAAEKVHEALGNQDALVEFSIQPGGAPESFMIKRPEPSQIVIIGSDAAGAMYGGLEVVEELRIGGLDAVEPDEQNPYMEMRGIKFNIPLDVRTPSYSDLGDAGQKAIDDVWDFEFWREFIDEMAKHRYNYLSLWNLHPFPSLVKVPEYPEVALDDVKRAVGLEEKAHDGRGRYFDSPEILDKTETLRKMSIDEKIAFWRKVMRYGKDRNVDLYFVTWNVFDYGTAGKYGIDDSLDNPVTIDYFRKSVKQLFLTYPELKGIGITTGENMHDASDQEKEDWMLKTYGLGVLDVFDEQPDRKVTFLHRQHQAGAIAIADTFKPLIDHPNVDFIFSYKYAKAHAYSSTVQPFYKSFAREIQDRGDLKTIWTMRNDSTYYFRWAAPGFLREYVQNIPIELTRGYYFGSDGWIWGREFLRKEGDKPRPLELQKHWFQWMLWGRLAYDPSISDERFAGILHSRFPQVDGEKLMEAWEAASMVYPLTTGFHWGPLDFHWYPEACVGVKGNSETGFHDVDSFISLQTHPGTGYVSIPDYVKVVLAGDVFHGTGPLEISKRLGENASRALDLVKTLDAGDNAELSETLADIQCMAFLERYYASKIAGATYLHLFRERGRQGDQVRAIESLERAAEAWRHYTAHTLERYVNRVWMSRIRLNVPVDFEKITNWVEEDINIAKRAVPGSVPTASAFTVAPEPVN